MRILFFSHYFPPEGNAPASRTHANAKRWVAAGHEVTVITCAPNCPEGKVYQGYKNRLLSRETVDGIQVRRVWTLIAANEGTLLRTANYLSYMFSAALYSLVVRRPDVMIATSPQFFCGWAGAISSVLRRVPFILEIRDIWPESIVAVGAIRKSPAIRILEWMEHLMYAAAERVVTVGDGYRKRLLERGVPDAKISVVMNGVDRELFRARECPASFRRTWQIENKFVCSYIGTIGMACGLDVVLEAAGELKRRGVRDVVFMLVGDGASRKNLQSRAQAEGLDNVIFTGRQPKEAMPDFLSASDVCLVHLRKTELFTSVMPSKIFEAAGMGKPIINGVGGFAAEFITKAGAGINIEPENSSQLVHALLEMKDNPSVSVAYGKAGHDYVIKNFDRDKLAGEYLAMIELVLRNKMPRRKGPLT
jgi:glycosyltransferase involved in cell wall biosynthesis